MSGKNILLMGDFNYGGIDWDLLQPGGGCTVEGGLFLDCVVDNLLTQHVKEPTRDGATLDLVLTTEPDLIDEIEMNEFLGGSDHRMLTWQANFQSARESVKHAVFDYKKADLEAMTDELQQINWDETLTGNTEQAWGKFKEILFNLQDKHVPIKKVCLNGRSKPVWMSYKAVRLVEKKT